MAKSALARRLDQLEAAVNAIKRPVRLHILTHEELVTGVYPAGFSHYIETWKSRMQDLPAPKQAAPAADVELPVTPPDPMEDVAAVLAPKPEPDRFHGQRQQLDTWRHHHPDA